MTTIRINLADEQGILLGQVTITPDELRAARGSAAAAFALVEELAVEAGVR